MREPQRWYDPKRHSGHAEIERRFKAQHEGIGPEVRAALRRLRALLWWRRRDGEQ